MDNVQYLYKDAFAVIGKAGKGPADRPQEWIPPLWEAANGNFGEISGIVRKDDKGAPLGVWGAMNDVEECNKRWGDVGKYMAGCEADVDAKAPEGWTKWVVPAQTYLVAACDMEGYAEVFGRVTGDESIVIVGTVHERYPEPGNSNKVELYFPVAEGMIYCQSCSMPLVNPEEFGTEADGSASRDYCRYCYENGAFTKDMTMEEMIEACVPFCRDHYENDEAARADMLSLFPKLLRWSK